MPWKDLCKLSTTSKGFNDLVSKYNKFLGQNERLQNEKEKDKDEKELKKYWDDIEYRLFSKDLFEVFNDWTTQELDECNQDTDTKLRDLVSLYRKITGR